MALVIDRGAPRQPIEGFGVGSWGSPEMLAADAALMFSVETGLGLSSLRIFTTESTGIERRETSPNSSIIPGTPDAPTDALRACQFAMQYGARIFPAIWQRSGDWISAAGVGAKVAAFIADAVSRGITFAAFETLNEVDHATEAFPVPDDGAWRAYNEAVRAAVKAANPNMLFIGPATTRPQDISTWTNPILDLVDRVSWHQYGTNTAPASPQGMGAYGKLNHQTEVSTFNDTFDPSIYNGLTWANAIHQAMTVSESSLWHYCTWNYSKFTPPSYVDDNMNLLRGMDSPSPRQHTKRMWVLAHYARFIRPGFQRVTTSGASWPLTGTAYTGPTGEVVVVAFNDSDGPLTLDLTGLDGVASLTPYITDATRDLQALGPVAPAAGALSYEFPARSIITFTNYTPEDPPGAPGDTTPPTIGSFSVPSSPHASATVEVTVSATDETALHAAPYAVTVDTDAAPTTWQASGTFTLTLTEGAHTLRAYARDAAGNVVVTSRTITVSLPLTDVALRHGDSAVTLRYGSQALPVTLKYKP